ncbi:MAG: flagellar brake domain-containing protein [Candidatus Melainabacteria bacterium]|nr:MAG: flagellar brake domain-containing protein [Candidatus Melainabacteria bacterium]
MKALKIGNEVKVEYLNSEGKVSSIVSKISNIEYDRLELSTPKENYEEACEYLNEGTTILVYIYTSNGIRAFDSIVLNPLKEKLIIDFPNDYKNIQRRKNTFVQIG